MLYFKRNIYRTKKIKKPKLRLIFIHHAGGSAFIYFKFAELFPDTWEICFLELPGRGKDKSEKAIQNRNELYNFFEFTTSQFNDEIPLALFGHSMGAQIIFEYAHYLHKINNHSLKWLAISAKKPPKKVLNDHNNLPLCFSSNEVLIEKLKLLGGTPNEFFESQELMNFFLPILKKDLLLCHNLESTCFQPSALKIPITIFSGSQDLGALPHEMEEWKDFTTSHFTAQKFNGGHFYFQGIENKISQTIIQYLNQSNLI